MNTMTLQPTPIELEAADAIADWIGQPRADVRLRLAQIIAAHRAPTDRAEDYRMQTGTVQALMRQRDAARAQIAKITAVNLRAYNARADAERLATALEDMLSGRIKKNYAQAFDAIAAHRAATGKAVTK